MALINLYDHYNLSYLALGDIHADEPIIFLHGIMGSKKNLRGFLEKFHQSLLSNSVIVFDLRNHGESTKHWAPYTVESCAHDIFLAVKKLNISPRKIIGHSFGAKVALLSAEVIPTIEQLWLLDCPPGQVSKKPVATTTARDVLKILLSLSWPVASRKNLVDELIKNGIDKATAAWMTTNLVHKEDGLYLIFNPQEIHEMMQDFIQLDLWPNLERLSHRMQVHLLKAEFGNRISLDDENHFKHKISTDNFHVLKNAGHFVHADNPLGLIDILKKHLDP